jgi:hypothetical protein
MHVRVAGSNDVFAAKGVNAFGIPDTSRRYYDPKYTVADMGLVDFVKVKNLHGELTATRADDTWSLGELPEGEQVDKSTLDKIGRSLSLRINGIVGKGLTLAEYGLDGTRRIEWSTTEDETTTNHGFTIGRMEEGRYYVKADDNDFVIQVSETALKTPLQATSFSKPIGEEAQAPPPPPGGMPGMGGMDGPPRGLPPRLPPTP